jgi:hypothetical protein
LAVLGSGHHRNSNLLRYTTENRSSPRVVTGKWLLKNKKNNYKVHKIKPGPISKLKPQKQS